MMHSRTKLAFIQHITREYCTENFVTAVKFLADRRLLKVEKYWWIAWIAASFIASCFCVVSLYYRWKESPVVLAYAPRLVPISTVPFPAITVCPLSKARNEVFNITRAFEFIERGIKLDDESERKLRSLAHVCPFSYEWNKFEHQLPEEDLVERLHHMSLGMRKTVSMCTWRTRLIPCGKVIAETLTDDGICYTFNALPANQLYREDQISPDFLNITYGKVPTSNWTRESGFKGHIKSDTYPKRSLKSGLKSGLAMLLAVRKIDDEFACKGSFTGFKISVHAPDETAFTGDNFYRLNTLHGLSITLKPDVTYTTNFLRHISPNRRSCFFADERYLRYYRTYNYHNCLQECTSNLTLTKCGCVKFSMPRAAGMKICDASRIGCYRNTILQVYYQAIKATLENRSLPCSCRQECNVLRYRSEIHRFPFNIEHLRVVAGPFMDYFKGQDLSVVQVSFKHRHYLPIWRRELFGLTDVIARFGGLFGLLMGASMMSLGEICYYMCIRPLRRERTPALIQVRP